MNPNQNKPLNSFLPANASRPSTDEAPPKAGVWDDEFAEEVVGQIVPDSAKSSWL